MNPNLYAITLSEIQKLNGVNYEAQYNLAMLHGSSFEMLLRMDQEIEVLHNKSQGYVSQVNDGEFTHMTFCSGDGGRCLCTCDLFLKLQMRVKQGVYCQHILKLLLCLSHSTPINDSKFIEIVKKFF